MATMLEKAKAVMVKGPKNLDERVNAEELELLIALTRGEVNRSQVAAVLAIPKASVDTRRAVVFARAVRVGVLHPEQAQTTPW